MTDTNLPVAEGDPVPPSRTEARLAVHVRDVKFRESNTSGTGVTLDDLSRKGFRTIWPYTLREGDRVWLTLPGLEAKSARVRWTRGYAIGCEFDEPMHEAVFDHLMRRIQGTAKAR